MITLQEVGQNKSGTVVHWPSDATTAAQSASFGDITITSSALLFTCHEKIVSTVCQQLCPGYHLCGLGKSKGQKHGHFHWDSSIRNQKAHILFLHRLFWAWLSVESIEDLNPEDSKAWCQTPKHKRWETGNKFAAPPNFSCTFTKP